MLASPLPITWDEAHKSARTTIKDAGASAWFREGTSDSCNAGVRANVKMTSGVYKWTVCFCGKRPVRSIDCCRIMSWSAFVS